jgi:hypothetical protein
MLTWNRAVVVFSALGLLASGCGDDEERLTEEAFLEQGNAICEAGNERIDALFEETFQGEADFEDDEKIAEFKAALESDVQGQIDDLGELEPPEELEDDVESLLENANAALDEVREMDSQEFFESEGGGDVFADVDRQAGEVGLTACAEDGGEEEGGEEQGEEAAAPDHTVIDVTATEYSFALASPTLTAGPIALHLVNDGEEQHELSFARIGEGHTLQEALDFEGDPEQAGLITDPSGDSGRIDPGEDIFVNVDLEPGTYGMVCFVEAPDGTPHAFNGMALEFEVTA